MWSKRSIPTYFKGGSCLCSNDEYCVCSPSLAIDVIIEVPSINSVVVVKRKDNLKYATIGGFVEIGESVESCVERELREETGLQLAPGTSRLFGIYSDPRRDTRRHTVSAVFIAQAVSLSGLRAGDDAKQAEAIPVEKLLSLEYAFDHRVIISDYLKARGGVSHELKEGALWERSTCA